VFDLDPPYNVSAARALHLLQRFPDIRLVITCADSALALKKAPWLSGYPVFQKPYEMDEIANTVQSMFKRVSKTVAAVSVGA
jgi:hypothetical protein